MKHLGDGKAMIKGKAVKETGCYKKEKVKRNEMSQAASRLAWDMEEKVNDLCSLIAAYIHLYAFPHRCFCNLRKSLARSCIHIFLATGRADLRRDIPNNNGRLTSGKCDRCGSWFSLSILADDTLHECFLLVFISGSHLSMVGSYAVITITCCLPLFSAATTCMVRSLHLPSSNFAENGNACG